MEILVGFLTVLIGLIGIIQQTAKKNLEMKIASLQSDLDKKNSALDNIKEYAKQLTLIDYVNHDVIFLGPRQSGKTSILQLWVKPWFEVVEAAATAQWETYTVDVFELGKKSKLHQLFDVHMNHRETLRITIHDYPGEDQFRMRAIDHLSELQKAVLILVFDLKTGRNNKLVECDKNLEYYSQAIIEKISQHKGITTNLSKVIVCFNKIDKIRLSYSNKNQMIDELKKINAAADKRIRELFGGLLEYHAVSALDNTGIISLLGAASSASLNDKQKEKYYTEMKAKYNPPTDFSREL